MLNSLKMSTLNTTVTDPASDCTPTVPQRVSTQNGWGGVQEKHEHKVKVKARLI